MGRGQNNTSKGKDGQDNRVNVLTLCTLNASQLCETLTSLLSNPTFADYNVPQEYLIHPYIRDKVRGHCRSPVQTPYMMLDVLPLCTAGTDPSEQIPRRPTVLPLLQ